MTIATGIRRRIDALSRAINPAGSLRARLATLTDDQRAVYHAWRERCTDFHTHHANGEAYALVIDDPDAGPYLRGDVREALFGPDIGIPVGSTAEQAATIWRAFVDGQQ